MHYTKHIRNTTINFIGMLECLKSFSSPKCSSITEFKYWLEQELGEYEHSPWPNIKSSSTMVEDWIYNALEENLVWLSVRTFSIDSTSLACSKFSDGFLSSCKQNSSRSWVIGFATDSSFAVECDWMKGAQALEKI